MYNDMLHKITKENETIYPILKQNQIWSVKMKFLRGKKCEITLLVRKIYSKSILKKKFTLKAQLVLKGMFGRL